MTDYESKPSGCEVADDLLSAYIDGELSETEAQFVRKHVESCAVCPGVLDELESTISALAALPKEAIPEHDLWDDIVADYEAGGIVDLRAERTKRFGWIPLSKAQLLAAAIAAVMLPAVFAGGMMMGMRRDDNGSGVVRVVDRFEPRDVRAPEPIGVTVPTPPGRPTAPQVRAAPRPDRSSGIGRNGSREAVINGLITALQDPDADVRKSAAIALGDMNDAEMAVPALMQALATDSNGEVRRWAAYGLGEIGDERAVGVLMQALLNDSFAEARRWSAYALSEIASPSAVGALETALIHDSNPEVRRWSAYALGEIGEPQAADALTAALQDPNAEVRRWAAWALAEIADNL